MKNFRVIFILFGLFFAFSSPSYAITNVHSLSVVQIIDYSGDCGQTIDYTLDNPFVDEGLVIVFSAIVTGTNHDYGGPTDSVAYILKDATGKPIMYSNFGVLVGATGTETYGWNLQHSPRPDAFPWTVYLYETTDPYGLPNYPDGREPIANLSFDPRDWIDTCTNQTSGEIDTPPDDRLNWRFGDNGFVLYKGEENSDILFHVYSVDGESNGSWLLSITKTQAEYYKNNPPDEDIQFNRYENVSVFALSTGEIQINMYNLTDDKTYVLVFSSEGEIKNSYVLVGFYLNL